MNYQRKSYTAATKIAILKRHLLQKVRIADLCEELCLHPTTLYHWRKELFENGTAAFQKKVISKGLASRQTAALHRSSGPQSRARVFVSPSLEIDFETHRVWAQGKECRLTPKEFELLRFFVDHTGQLVTHEELMRAVQGDRPYMRVFISNVRKKIEENPAKPRYIVTEPWMGYRFSEPASN
jgi:two-component system KDP operon response regulator KdpE